MWSFLRCKSHLVTEPDFLDAGREHFGARNGLDVHKSCDLISSPAGWPSEPCKSARKNRGHLNIFPWVY